MTYTEQNELFEQNMNIVYYCFNKLNKNNFVLNSQEDIIQEGLTALWNAVLTFDSNKAERFATYAFPCVRNRMLNWIRDNSVFNCCSIEEPIQTNIVDGEPLYIKDLLSVDCDFDSIDDLKNNVIDNYEKWLTKRHKSRETILLKLIRARIILSEFLENPDITSKQLQEKYTINRTIISDILRELRLMLKNDYPTSYIQSKRISHVT